MSLFLYQLSFVLSICLFILSTSLTSNWKLLFYKIFVSCSLSDTDKLKNLHGYLYVPDAGGIQVGYDDATLLKLACIARDNRVNKIIIESNFGDGMFTKVFLPVLNRVYKCAVEEVRHNTQKEKRIIDTLEPVMNRHRLVFDADLIKRDVKAADSDVKMSLIYQLTHITKDRGSLKHDDRLDALAIAVNYWVEAMARDEKFAREDYEERLLNEQLQDFMDGVLLKDRGEHHGHRNARFFNTLHSS